MPTDTTIIDRLRGLAEMMGSDGEAEAEASAIMLAAADALAAAHAARDAAEQTLQFNDACWQDERGVMLSTVHDLRAQLTTALRERDEARAALAAARYSCDHEGVCLLIDTKPDGTR